MATWCFSLSGYHFGVDEGTYGILEEADTSFEVTMDIHGDSTPIIGGEMVVDSPNLMQPTYLGFFFSWPCVHFVAQGSFRATLGIFHATPAPTDSDSQGTVHNVTSSFHHPNVVLAFPAISPGTL